MTTYRYRGRAYRQALDASAPWLLSFVANADDLKFWAGVPRRTDQNQAGFQRLESQPRIDQAKEYFQQPLNQSPTSLILGLHGRLSDEISAVLEFLPDDDEDSGGSQPCELVVTYKEPSVLAARDIVRTQLMTRLADSPQVEVQGEGPNATSSQQADPATEVDAVTGNEEVDLELGINDGSEDEDSDDGDFGADDDPDALPDELELGDSVVGQLLAQLDDDAWLAVGDNAAAILDLAKPATIIDGQHRLLGADATERAIPFSVVALADCPWPEQVFQFTVVNYTAKGIPDQFITANAALSLTKPELDILKTRLVQANVKIKEYDLMRVVNFDSRSPFSGLINLTEKANRSLIGYKTMVQAANQWFDARHQFFNTLLPNLYSDITGKGHKTKRREKWREGDWGEFFLAFWQEVYQEFHNLPSEDKNHKLWDVGHSQLTVAVVLLELQSAFIDNLNAQDEDIFVVTGDEEALAFLVDKVRGRAAKFVKFFPPAFFQKKWGVTSLNTGSGRIDLQSCIREMVASKGKYSFWTDRLFTGG
jgi:hypothetical protein